MMQRVSLTAKQVTALIVGLLLGVALFMSPIRLHHAGSFTVPLPSAHEQHGTTSRTPSQPSPREHQNMLRCLRCVLQAFEVAETLQPLIVVVAVLGFLVVAKPLEPSNIVSPSKTARAPPLI